MSNKALKAYRIGNTFNVIIQSEVENPFEATQILRRNGTEMALVASDQIDIQEVLDIFNTRTPQSPEAKDCKWSQDINDEYYDSECGLAWQMMNDDSLEDNKMNYCPKCGGKIVCESDKEEDKNG